MYPGGEYTHPNLPAYGPTPSAISFGASNTMWVGSEFGLRRFSGSDSWTYQVGNSGLPSNRVFSLVTDDQSTLWIGTDKGLALLDGNAAPLKAFTTDVNDRIDAEPLTPLIMGLSPNPTSGTVELFVNLLTMTPTRVSIHNALGQEVLSVYEGVLEEGARSIACNTSALPAGAYMVYVKAGQFVECRQLIVSR